MKIIKFIWPRVRCCAQCLLQIFIMAGFLMGYAIKCLFDPAELQITVTEVDCEQDK